MRARHRHVVFVVHCGLVTRRAQIQRPERFFRADRASCGRGRYRRVARSRSPRRVRRAHKRSRIRRGPPERRRRKRRSRRRRGADHACTRWGALLSRSTVGQVTVQRWRLDLDVASLCIAALTERRGKKVMASTAPRSAGSGPSLVTSPSYSMGAWCHLFWMFEVRLAGMSTRQ